MYIRRTLIIAYTEKTSLSVPEVNDINSILGYLDERMKMFQNGFKKQAHNSHDIETRRK